MNGSKNLQNSSQLHARPFQFTLRRMLVVVTAIAVIFAIAATLVRQEWAVQRIRRIGGDVNEEKVFLSGTQVTDAGLADLRTLRIGLYDVEVLGLSRTRITDAELVHLRQLPKLRTLFLDGTAVTDRGLHQLSLLTRMKWLGVGDTHVTDEGLVYLRSMSGLERLDLDGTNITDVGLVHLYGLNNLVWLNLERTRVSEDGLAKLRRALPNTQIRH
jgi:hypothetical protein